ncbi:Sphingomyelin synthase-related protein 1 [Balamuthia mandrillaris]
MGKKKRSVSNKERTATDTVTTATAVIKASEWSVSDVSKWLGMGGYGRYAEKFAKNNVDGEILLSLTEHDLREEPLALGVIGDIKRLSWTIQQLRAQDTGYTRHLPSEPRLLDAAVDGFASSSLPSQQRRRSLETDSSSPPLAKTRPRSRSIHPLLDEEGHQVEVGEEEGFAEVLKRWQREYGKLSKEGGVWWPFSSPTKTRASFLPVWHVDERFASALSRLVMSFLFLLFSAMATALTMTFVHERVPDPTSYPPLPDIILDNVPHMPVAFTLAEYTIFSLALIFFVTVLLHRFRMVILRRFCCITAMVFLLRCCTMFVTSLSVPGTHVKCDHHLSGIPEDQLTNGIEDKLRAAWAIFSGLGLSVNGVRTCGDYMFSGHTVMLTIFNCFILEYTDSKWKGLHIFSWVMNLFGMFFILAGHEHYSIDVLMAYYISTHLFLHYHNLANSMVFLSEEERSNKGFYMPLFNYLEEDTQGVVPNEYELLLMGRLWAKNCPITIAINPLQEGIGSQSLPASRINQQQFDDGKKEESTLPSGNSTKGVLREAASEEGAVKKTAYLFILEESDKKMEQLRAVQNYIDNFSFHGAPFTSPELVVGGTFFYLIFIFGLRQFIKEPMRLKAVTAVHNLFLCLLSLLMAVGVVAALIPIVRNYGWSQIYCDEGHAYADRNSPSLARGSLAFWCYVFYVSKYYEMIDTLLLVLKKKNLEFVHVYHHFIVPYLFYFFCYTDTTGQWILVLNNSIVHVFMYYYYMVQTFGYQPWWKRYLTQLQIVQFFIDMSATWPHIIAIPILGVWDCRGHIWSVYFGQAVGLSFIFLFTSFYIRTYTGRRSATAAAEDFAAKTRAAGNGSGAAAAAAGGRRKVARKEE